MLVPNIALSFGSAAILHAVASGSRFGFDIMQATGLTSGTVYPALDKLESAGYLESSWEDAAAAHAEGRPARWVRRSESRPVRRSESDPLEGGSFYVLLT